MVLGVIYRPPFGKKSGTTLFWRTCSNTKKATVEVIKPV
jgi:hypothetical protein